MHLLPRLRQRPFTPLTSQDRPLKRKRFFPEVDCGDEPACREHAGGVRKGKRSAFLDYKRLIEPPDAER
jgi:hypothetical protein